MLLYIVGVISHSDGRAYTSSSEYREFEEGKKRQFNVGEKADFIVLSDDLSKIPSSTCTKVRVLRTVVGGPTVYQAE